jgi:hypothetical protein
MESNLVCSSALVIKELKFIVVGSSPSVNATSDDKNSGSIDGEADGVRRSVARVPGTAVACTGKPVWS